MNLELWILNHLRAIQVTDIYFICISISLILYPFVIFRLAKRFDLQFKDATEEFLPLANGLIGRTGWYEVTMIAQGLGKKIGSRTVYYVIFKNYNLWKIATVFDKILVVMHLIPALIAALIVACFYVHKIL